MQGSQSSSGYTISPVDDTDMIVFYVAICLMLALVIMAMVVFIWLSFTEERNSVANMQRSSNGTICSSPELESP